MGTLSILANEHNNTHELNEN